MMVVDKFVLGVFATISVEAISLVIAGIISYIKRKEK